MKGIGWDWKKIKRIEPETEQHKVCAAVMAATFLCKPVQIKSYCKARRWKSKKLWEGKQVGEGGWQQRTPNLREVTTHGVTWGQCKRAMSQETGQERTRGDTSVWAQPAVWDRCCTESPVRTGTTGRRDKGSTTGGSYEDSWREKRSRRTKGWMKLKQTEWKIHQTKGLWCWWKVGESSTLIKKKKLLGETNIKLVKSKLNMLNMSHTTQVSRPQWCFFDRFQIQPQVQKVWMC